MTFIKAGPIDRASALAYLSEYYSLHAEALLDAAQTSPTGMASRALPSGRRVWVSALVTMPGKYMIEVE